MTSTVKKIIQLHITKADFLMAMFAGTKKDSPISNALKQASLANTKFYINFDGDIEVEIDTTMDNLNKLDETLNEMEEQDLANQATSDAN